MTNPIPVIKNLLTLRGVTLALFAFHNDLPMSQASYIANGLVVPQNATKRRAIARYLEMSEEAIFPSNMIKGKKGLTDPALPIVPSNQ